MTDYPQKNRRARTLRVLHLEVEDQNGVQQFDPNGIILWELDLHPSGPGPSGGSKNLVPFDFLPDLHSRDQGCVIYRSDNLEIRLSRQQLGRLIRLDLHALEYFQLRELFGMFHEIHEDFYDPETGEALQPKRRS